MIEGGNTPREGYQTKNQDTSQDLPRESHPNDSDSLLAFSELSTPASPVKSDDTYTSGELALIISEAYRRQGEKVLAAFDKIQTHPEADEDFLQPSLVTFARHEIEEHLARSGIAPDVIDATLDEADKRARLIGALDWRRSELGLPDTATRDEIAREHRCCEKVNEVVENLEAIITSAYTEGREFVYDKKWLVLNCDTVPHAEYVITSDIAQGLLSRAPEWAKKVAAVVLPRRAIIKSASLYRLEQAAETAGLGLYITEIRDHNEVFSGLHVTIVPPWTKAPPRMIRKRLEIQLPDRS